MDALLVTRSARSFAELSLAATMQRRWPSLYEALRDGQIDLNNATGQAGGIEIWQNKDVIITNNEVTNNLGPGMSADPASTYTNFLITGNKIYNNGTNLYDISGTAIQEVGDCFTP